MPLSNSASCQANRLTAPAPCERTAFFGPFRAVLCQALPRTRVESPFGPFYSRVYDRWTAQTTLDTDHYCDQLGTLGPGQRFIDLGCGTGRVSRRLAAYGHVGVCVDTSRSMLAALEDRAAADALGDKLHLVQADLRHLALGQPFDAAILGGLTFSLFASDDDRWEVLRAAHSYLRPGGLLMFDYLPSWLNQETTHDAHFAFGGSSSSLKGFCWVGVHRDETAGVQLANLMSEVVDADGCTERILASTVSYLLDSVTVHGMLHSVGFASVEANLSVPGTGPIVTCRKI